MPIKSKKNLRNKQKMQLDLSPIRTQDMMIEGHDV